MNITKIKIKELVKDKLTYPSWSTNSIYNLEFDEKDNEVKVFYKIKGNRIISRIFPKEIVLSNRLIYVLGLLKGEGSNSLGKSNYRRFTITNSDPLVIKIILLELDRSGLFKIANLQDKSLHIIHHTGPDQEANRLLVNCLRSSQS